MLIKLIGALLIVGAGVMVSRRIKYEYRESCAEIEAFLKIIDSIKTDILFKKLPVSDCLSKLEIENERVAEFINKIKTALAKGETVVVAAEKAIEESELVLKQNDMNPIKEFFFGLGQSPYENQLENAMYAMEKLTCRLGEARKDEEKNEKTKCSLVLGATLAVVIVLC